MKAFCWVFQFLSAFLIVLYKLFFLLPFVSIIFDNLFPNLPHAVRNIVCDFRRWLQAVFHVSDGLKPSYMESAIKFNLCQENVEPIPSSRNSDQLCQSGSGPNELANDLEVDMSEGMAFEMFGISHSSDEVKVPFNQIC